MKIILDLLVKKVLYSTPIFSFGRLSESNVYIHCLTIDMIEIKMVHKQILDFLGFGDNLPKLR